MRSVQNPKLNMKNTFSIFSLGLLYYLRQLTRVCMQNIKKWLNWSTWETVAI